MAINIFDDKPTDLDLNGPILSFTTNPTGVGSTGVGIGSSGGGSVSLTGIATATFPTTANNTGYVTYRWYEQGVGALSDSTYVTGTATTTLTLSNLITPTDNQRKYYVEADYVPSYYVTGNAPNEPLNSGVGTVTVDPLIEIVSQPSSVQVLVNEDGTITVNADITDSHFISTAGNVSYQWILNGSDVTDGTITDTWTTGSDTSGTVENTYTSDASHTFPSIGISDVELTVAGGSGGNGGSDSNGSGGRGGQGRAGRFSLPSDFAGTKLDFYVGKRGNGGGSGNQNAGGSGGLVGSGVLLGVGGDGGGAGQNGWSGGGGGGGAASYVIDPTGRIIVSAGGGGGGGGSWNSPAPDAFGNNPGVGLGYGHGNSTNPLGMNDGNQGSTKNGDGGGGGGGGGGVSGGSGGNDGQDNSHGASPGNGGTSGAKTPVASIIGSGWLNDSDGYINLKYTGYTDTTVTTTRNTVISGSTTQTLTIRSDVVGVQTAQCKITYPYAINSPVLTDEVNFVTVSSTDENNINVESIGVTDSATLSSINLNNGEYTFQLEGTDVDNNGINQFYSFYSPDKDLDVEMDLYGGKGTDFSVWAAGMGWGDGFVGGEGGYSRIRFTMTQNTEYVIAGLIASVNVPLLYRKAQLIACVGQGGQGGHYGRGGFGGGVDVGGENGRGRLSGVGGGVIAAGGLSGNGKFGGAYEAPVLYPGDTQGATAEGGQTISCTKGVYWRNQGALACDDISGSTQFRLSDGTVVTNTAEISRGFKAGYNIMQTAGGGAGDGGNGGNGATGGTGGSSSGGGGASGYQDGSVTVVDTKLGGSTGDAKIILRLQS